MKISAPSPREPASKQPDSRSLHSERECWLTLSLSYPFSPSSGNLVSIPLELGHGGPNGSKCLLLVLSYGQRFLDLIILKTDSRVGFFGGAYLWLLGRRTRSLFQMLTYLCSSKLFGDASGLFRSSRQSSR